MTKEAKASPLDTDSEPKKNRLTISGSTRIYESPNFTRTAVICRVPIFALKMLSRFSLTTPKRTSFSRRLLKR